MSEGAINGDWAIGPFIGVARVGNSPDKFYLEPERAGTLPIEPAADDTAARDSGGGYVRVGRFKDDGGMIKRQAARLRVFRRVDDVWRPLSAQDVVEVTWTVHLANKKACWHDFLPLRGNLLFGPDNSYAASKKHSVLAWRNRLVRGEKRRGLIIDFGAREVSKPGDREVFEQQGSMRRPDATSVPQGEPITSLGEIRMNADRELLVLGGLGRAGGAGNASSSSDADGWYDDISDGPVTCTLRVPGRTPVVLQAWVIVGVPRFAPEIVSMVTLADVMEDVAIRKFDYRPDVFGGTRPDFKPGYEADFDRDIRPILERPGAYRWVVNAPLIQSVSPPGFDVRSTRPSKAVAEARLAYFSFFRAASDDGEIDTSHNALFNTNVPDPAPGFPAMPLNAGDNPYFKGTGLVDKFMSLTRTQLFMLKQWAHCRFTHSESPPDDGETPWSVTLGSLGNCLGAPLCPGIEVTWTVCNELIYSGPFQIRHRAPSAYARGLDPKRDETDATAFGEPGCEPGDLTKRMASPWQADFLDCSAQFIDIQYPIPKGDAIPAPPLYYAYWWPAHSPFEVIAGDLDPHQQALAGTAAGLPVLYQRGINSTGEMLRGWSYMGFVLNQTSGPNRDIFPNFVERERNNEQFMVLFSAVVQTSVVQANEQARFDNVWIMRDPVVIRPAPPAGDPPPGQDDHHLHE